MLPPATLRRVLTAFVIAPLFVLVAQPQAHAKVTISSGHVDVGSARIVGGKLRLLIKDDTGRKTRWRDPSSVVLRVVDRSRVRLSSGMGFAGRPGQTVWLIPQAQKRGVIWAGWNTERISRRQIRGRITWQLRSVSGPGRVTLFQTGSFGNHDVLFNSSRRLPQRYVISPGAHAHGNWSFAKRGTYRMRFTMKARSKSGRRLRDTEMLTFRVG